MTRTKRRNRPLPYVKQFLVPLVASRRCRYGTAVACIRAALPAQRGKKRRDGRREETKGEGARTVAASLPFRLFCVSLHLSSSTPHVSLLLFLPPSLSFFSVFLSLYLSFFSFPLSLSLKPRPKKAINRYPSEVIPSFALTHTEVRVTHKYTRVAW